MKIGTNKYIAHHQLTTLNPPVTIIYNAPVTTILYKLITYNYNGMLNSYIENNHYFSNLFKTQTLIKL